MHFQHDNNWRILPKKILDCGAGESAPPLRIFYEHEYEGEYGCMHGIEGHIHSYFEDDEPDAFFEGMEIVHKMKWEILKSEEGVDWMSIIEYIVRK